MTIAIADETNVATITESPSFFGRAYDGVVGGLQSKNLTGKEAFAGLTTMALLGVIGGSVLTRYRLKAAGDINPDTVSAKPILMFIG